MALFEGVNTKSMKAGKAEELLALPLDERLQRRIIDGEKNGLEADLDEALQTRPALDIVNDTLLEGMKVVGELFGSGQMQLPFVLQSAEVMKTAVAYLEPHMEKSDAEGKGTIVLATVRGDVHDIGKNLVDIILSNNGYNVVNIGIKQPVSAILEAAEEHRADVIGMSGLLVKSTVIMKENLEELNQRKLAADYPVILGGAALTRAYVEQDLHEIYEGEVRYARDAFEGLRLMDALIAVKRGVPGADSARSSSSAGCPSGRPPCWRSTSRRRASAPTSPSTTRSPSPPFWGTRVVKGIQLKEYASWLDEGALFKGQWGLKQARAGDGPTYEELVETEGRPRLRGWLDKLHTENLLEAAVVYGYFPCVSKGDDLILLDEDGIGAHPLHLPAPAPRPPPVPRGLLPPRGVRRDRRRRPPGRHGRLADRRGDRQALRGQLLPRLPGAARPVRPAGRGPRRVLARPGPLRARLRAARTRPTSRTCSR